MALGQFAGSALFLLALTFAEPNVNVTSPDVSGAGCDVLQPNDHVRK